MIRTCLIQTNNQAFLKNKVW